MNKTNIFIVPAIVFNTLKRNSLPIESFLNLDKIKDKLNLEQLSISYILNNIGIKLENKYLFSNLNNDISDHWLKSDNELFDIIKIRSELDIKLIDIEKYLSINYSNEDKKFDIIMNDDNVFIIIFSKIFEKGIESTIDVINRDIVENLFKIKRIPFSNLAKTAIFQQYFKSL